MFRPQATAEYVNANTRGALLVVAPVSARWLLGAATAVLAVGAGLAIGGRVRDSAEGRGAVHVSMKPVALAAHDALLVRAVRHAAGDAVRRGDALIDLDTSAAEKASHDCEVRAERLRRTAGTARSELEAQRKRSAVDDAVTYLLEQRVERADAQTEEERGRCEKLAAVAAVTSMSAPVDGTVAEMRVAAGAAAKEGDVLATVLPAAAASHAFVHVPESQVGRIAGGAPVYLRFDAYPYESFGTAQGRVVSILDDEATESEERRAGEKDGGDEDFHKIIEVEIDRAPAGVKIRPGLRFTASIVTGERSIASLLFAR